MRMCCKCKEIPEYAGQGYCQSCYQAVRKTWPSRRNRKAERLAQTAKAYSLTLEELQNIQTRKACAICGTAENLRIDHDHKTGAFRGVLCHSCNVGLGHFKDNSVRLRQAATYIDGGQKR